MAEELKNIVGTSVRPRTGMRLAPVKKAKTSPMVVISTFPPIYFKKCAGQLR